jgi:signal transduction histidine kinase
LLFTGSLLVTSSEIFIGSQYGLGIASLHSPFAPFYKSADGNGISLEHITGITYESDSTLLACADNGLLELNYKNGVIKQITGKEIFYTILSTGKEYIFSGPGGTFLYRPGLKPQHIKSFYRETELLDHVILLNTYKANDSLYLFAGKNPYCIYSWNKPRSVFKKDFYTVTEDGIPKNANGFLKDTRNNLWILSDLSIAKINLLSGKKQVIQTVGKNSTSPSGLNIDICEQGNKLWVAAYGMGLLRLSSEGMIEKRYGKANGIGNLGLYKLFSLNDSSLIVTSNNGLYVFNTKTEKANGYYEKNGIHSNSFEQNCGYQRNDTIFAGGQKGITVINTSELTKKQSTPPIYFGNISIEANSGIKDTFNVSLSKLIIPKDIIRLKITITSFNYAESKNILYSYRVHELNAGWSNPGTDNFFSLTNLPPGTYHLEVKAMNEDGAESEIKELTLIFLPKWYQTWWFKTLIALAVIAIVYSLYRMRINQLKKEQRIRTKLASDLHDDLGSTMNSVKVYANLAIMEKQADKYLPLIKQGSQEAITGIRDIIWVLDDKKNSLEQLLSRISLFASPLCEANHIIYKQELSDNARDHKLAQEERRNLYMIIKEALNNAIKYSNGKTIGIEVTLKKGRPSLQIKDDGKGFDTSKTSDGNGLKNMQRRAKEIKYDFRIKSSPGNGTIIHFEKI